MKAIQFTEYGGPEVLELVDIAHPEPGENQVVVKINAIGVNYADTARREGQYVTDVPLPHVPGSEVAGVIQKTGPGVTRFKEGDRVVTLLGGKHATGYAQYTIADERGLIPVPEGVDDNHAAAIPLQGLSAYHVIKTMGRLEQGESILVHAAAGGVGLFAVQLAKIFGAGSIIAAASTNEKRDLALEAGADVTVDYTKDGWEKEVLQATDNKGVDIALEMVGGDIFHQTLDCLAAFGRLVYYGTASRKQPSFNPARLMAENKSVIGFFLPQIMKKPQLFQQSLQEILQYIEDGKIKLEIGGVFPLEEAADVHRKLQGRQTKGKLILTP